MNLEESVQVPSLVCIAKLENGEVKLNKEQLMAISPEESHYPVAVVSVLGRTEEQRGAVVKALVECLYTQDTGDSCGPITNEGERNEVDAIFAVFPPRRIINEYGKEIAVLILDISCAHYGSPAYSKLANLCLLVSSDVIYTASCNGDLISSINIELKPVGPSFLSINHVWVIIQDCDSSYCSTPGDAHLLATEYENLGLSERTVEEVLLLGSYSDFAIRILLAKRSNDVVEECPLEGDSAKCSLAWKATCYKIFKTATHIEGVRLGFLMPYFRQHWCPAEPQMALANANPFRKSSYASAVQQSALLGAETFGSRGRGRGTRIFQDRQRRQCPSVPPDSSTPFKYETKEMKSAYTEPIEIDSPNEIPGNEYEECKNLEERSRLITSIVDSVSKKTSSGDQGKERDAIPAGGCVPEIRGTDSEMIGIQTKPAALTLSKESVSNLIDIILEAGDCTVEIGQEPMEVDIPHEIEPVHDDISQRNMHPEVTYKEITEKSIISSANSTIQNLQQVHFCDSGVAKNAVQYSLKRFTELVLPQNIYTVKYIKDVRDFVLEAFSFQELTPTFEKEKEKLQENLSTFLHERLEANFAMMRKLDQKEEKLRRLCGVYYKDKMSTKMSEETLSREKVEEFHEEAMHDTKQWFGKQCEDVVEPIKDYWGKVLDVKFEFWKTYYLDEFGVKHDLPRVTGFSLSAQNEQPIKTASVGIYFGPDVVQFGLYSSDIMAFNKSCIEILPFIGFKDEKILIGDEAKNCKTHKYNVFDIISRPTDKNMRTSVKLFGVDFCLSRNEVAVLFFHEAKKQFESLVKTQVGTCAVAASGLLPSASKQGLISAINMSGFILVKFIPSTTAILMWYLNWRQDQSYKTTQKDPRVLVIHHTGPLVEVVKAEISAGQHHSLNIRKIEGFLNYNDFNEPKEGKVVQSAVRHAISEAKEHSKVFEKTIIILGSRVDSTIFQHIKDGLTFNSGHCQEQSHRHILFSAAAYDAHNNGDESVSEHWPSFPTFNYLFPYKLSIEPWKHNTRKTINAEFPSSGLESLPVTLQRSESSFIVCESKKANVLFCYSCSCRDAKTIPSSPTTILGVTVQDNGTFNISGAQITCPNFQFICDYDLNLVKKNVAEVILEKERFMEKSKGSCQTDKLEENTAEDLSILKATLRNQLEDAKQRLEVSGDSIIPMILEGINDRIKACENLLSQRGVKEKQLTIAIGQLKVAANRIPSTN